MGCLLIEGEQEVALRLFIQFMTYMRPGECSQLLVKQLVRPQGSLNQSFNFWAILLHPIEDLVPGKTGIFDGSVILDSDPWLHPILEVLIKLRNPQQPLWSMPHGKLRDKFNKLIAIMLEDFENGGVTNSLSIFPSSEG